MPSQPQIETSAASSSGRGVRSVAIPAELVETVGPLVRHLVEKAAGYDFGRLTAAELLDDCAAGRKLLWVGLLLPERRPIGISVTAIYDYPDRRIGTTVAFGGEEGMLEWVREWQEAFEDWCRAEGCSSIEIVGRAAWGRLLPGYRERSRIYSKEL